MLQSRYFEVVLLIIWNNCVVSIGSATLGDVGDGALAGDGDESAW